MPTYPRVLQQSRTVDASVTYGRKRVFDIRDYGAVLDGSTDDGPAIQLALNAVRDNGGGTCFIPFAGSHVTIVGQKLIQYTNTIIELAPGVTLRRKTGYSGQLIANHSAVTAVRSVTDAAITAGSTTLTSATAAFTSADVGRYAWIAGATSTNGNTPHVARISSITNGTTAELERAATQTVSGAAMNLRDEEANIGLIGGLGSWIDGGDNHLGNPSDAQYGTTFFSTCQIYYRYVKNLYIGGLYASNTGGKYMFTIGAADTYLVENIRLNTHSDGVNHAGPVINGTVRNIQGDYTGDDMVSFGAQQMVNQVDVVGPIRKIRIENLRCTNCIEALRLQGGTNVTWSDIIVVDVKGYVQQWGIILADSFPGDYEWGTVASAVTIRDVSVTSALGYKNVMVSWATINDLVIDGVKISAATTGGVDLGTAGNGQAFTNVTLKDVTSSVALTTDAIAVAGGMTMATLRIQGLGVQLGTGKLAVNVGGTVGHLMLMGSSVSGGNSLVSVTGSVANIDLVETDALGLTGALVSLQGASTGAVDVSCSGVYMSSSVPVVQNLSAAGASVMLRGTGNRFQAGAASVLRNSSQTLRVNGADFLANVAILTPAAYDMVTNSNGSVTSGSGLVIYTGTAWRHMHTGNRSGGTPSITAGAGAGTSPTVSISGDDRGGVITVTTGSSPSTGAIATITYAVTRSAPPRVVQLQATNSAASGAPSLWLSTNVADKFVFATSVALTAATTYTWNYWTTD